MVKLLGVFVFSILVTSSAASAQDFQQAKILNVSSFKEAGSSIISPNNGYPVVIATSHDVFTVTVALKDMSVGAEFSKRIHFHPSELIVGDSILARLDGDKLILKTATGKEVKGKIMRRARLASTER